MNGCYGSKQCKAVQRLWLAQTNCVVLRTVKTAFWQVSSVIHFKSCIYQTVVFWGFGLSQQLSVPSEITQVSFIANSSWSYDVISAD